MNLLDPTVDVAEWAEAASLNALATSLAEASAAISAAQARFARAMAIFRARDGHGDGSGFSSFGQWASVDLGLSSRAATNLAGVADTLAELPHLEAAWRSGTLSTTKATTVASVATAGTDEHWCALALEASATQLSRIASAYRRSTAPAPDDPSPADLDAACRVSWHTRDDGLVELLAILAPDDAAVVRAALETIAERDHRAASDDSTDDSSDDDGVVVPFRPRRSTAQRMADALAEMAAGALHHEPSPVVRGEHTEVVIHIDADYLADRTDHGLCHTTNGPIDRASAQTLACDARIRPLIRGRDGTPLDLGRSQRLVSTAQRRLLTARDHGCRFPGCTNHRYVDAHHVQFWEHGGPTDLDNLISLCGRHHRLLHQGHFTIEALGDQQFSFIDRHGHRIGGPPAPSEHTVAPSDGSPRARSGGDPRYSVDDAVTGIASRRRDQAS